MTPPHPPIPTPAPLQKKKEKKKEEEVKGAYLPPDTSQLENEQLQFNLRKDLSHLALPGPHFLHHDHHRTQSRKTLQGVRRENRHTIRACDICPHLDALELTWSQISTHAMTSLANSWGTLNAVRRCCSSESGHSARRQRVCGMRGCLLSTRQGLNDRLLITLQAPPSPCQNPGDIRR